MKKCTMRIPLFSFLIIASLLVTGPKGFIMADEGSLESQMDGVRSSVTDSLLELRADAETYLAITSKTNSDANSSVDAVPKTDQEEIFPLLENEVLSEVAETLCTRAISEGLANIDANATRDLLEKAGYKTGDNIHVDALGIIMQEYIKPHEGARLLLKGLVDAPSRDLREGDLPAILDKRYKEIGVGFCGGTAQISSSEKANIYILVIILASPEGPQPQWIQCGHVYYDINNNHAFDPGEGLRDVLLSDGNGTLLARTRDGGEYCFRRPKGNWVLYIEAFPFIQDYTDYNEMLDHRKDGILWQDYPLLLTQGVIDAKRKNEEDGEKQKQ